MFVLDTNTLIHYFKGMGNVATRLLAQRPSDIAIPTIVVYEVEVGIAKSTAPDKRRQQLWTLLQSVQVLPFDVAGARKAAVIRADLENKGTPIGNYDILIAATAMAHGATLVTHSTGEFSCVSGLQVEDWF